MKYIDLESRNIRTLFVGIFGFIWILIYYISQFGYVQLVGKCLSILLIIQALWLIFRSYLKKNIVYVVIFGFVFLYTWPTKLFFFDGIYFSAHNLEYTYYTAITTTLIFSLFMIVINGMLKVPFSHEMQKLPSRKNDVIFYILFIITFIIIITCKRSGNVYMGEDTGVSSLNEYVIILFLVLNVYCTKSDKFKNCLLFILYLLYSGFALMNGGRIEVVLIAMLLLVIRFQYTISFRKILLLFVLIVWVMGIFGKIRSNPTILFRGDIVNIVNPFSSEERILNSQGTNEGDVFWASERMFVLINDGELSFEERIVAGIEFLLSSFIPRSYLSSLANLSNYKEEIVTTGGGGLAPIFIYVMFGFFGVVLLGIFVAKMLNSLAGSPTIIAQFYTILMIVMLPRWFAYYPVHLIRFCVFGLIFLCFTISFDNTLRKYITKSI